MRVYSYFIFSFWKAILFKNKSICEKLVWDDLMNKYSFRYGQNDKYTYRIFLVFLNKSLKLIKKNEKQLLLAQSKELVYDLIENTKEERLTYIKNISGKENFQFIGRDQFEGGHLSLFRRLMLVIGVIFIFIFSVIIAPLKKVKANLALLPLEYLELVFLVNYVKQNKIEKIYFFSAFEKGACLISHFLITKLKVEVQLIPSPNPISNYYNNVICSTFTFTVPYQEMEYHSLKKKWIVEDFMRWPLAGYQSIVTTINRKTELKTIGFISSGNWLRHKLGHGETGKGYFEAEENLLNILKNFISKNTDWKLLISLHPIEKRNDEYLKLSKEYYDNFFGTNYKFVPFNIVTRERPELFDIGISGYSSATFERLFAGYKTLFSQKGMQENFYGDERLSSITCNTSESFEKLIIEISEIDHDEFFKKFDLTSYRYKDNSKYMETFKL